MRQTLVFKKGQKKLSVNRKNGSLITKQLKKKVYYFRVRYSYKKAGGENPGLAGQKSER